MEQLNAYINPANYDLDKNDETHRLQQMSKPVDEHTQKAILENKLKDFESKNAIENFDNYMNIMLSKHLKFNEVEEAEIKKRKLEGQD